MTRRASGWPSGDAEGTRFGVVVPLRGQRYWVASAQGSAQTGCSGPPGGRCGLERHPGLVRVSAMTGAGSSGPRGAPSRAGRTDGAHAGWERPYGRFGQICALEPPRLQGDETPCRTGTLAPASPLSKTGFCFLISDLLLDTALIVPSSGHEQGLLPPASLRPPASGPGHGPAE